MYCFCYNRHLQRLTKILVHINLQQSSKKKILFSRVTPSPSIWIIEYLSNFNLLCYNTSFNSDRQVKYQMKKNLYVNINYTVFMLVFFSQLSFQMKLVIKDFHMLLTISILRQKGSCTEKCWYKQVPTYAKNVIRWKLENIYTFKESWGEKSSGKTHVMIICCNH